MCRAWNPLAPAIWKRSSYMADDESECSSVDSDVDSDCSTDDEALGTASPIKMPKRRHVTFVKDVKFQSTRPRRSYKGREHEDMVKDEGKGHRIAYVRLPGASKVVEVAFYDGENQMMERNLSSMDSKKIIERRIFRCMVQPVILRKKIKFLMDTGCGHDLIAQKKIEKHDFGDTGTYLISDGKRHHRHRSGVQFPDRILQGADQRL
eukprot:s1457_g4.t1